MTKTIDEQVLERLDQILKVLALSVGPDQTMTERARLLKIAGLDNQTIAKILETNPNTVRALLSGGRDRLGRRR